MKPHKIPESVLVVIHTSAMEVLLLERADRPGFWQSVTGSLDAPDEPLLLTAARELFEETGIVADGELIRLRDWGLSNIYEIYPVWRHRYAPASPTIPSTCSRSASHATFPSPSARASICNMPGCPGSKRPIAASHLPTPKPSSNCRIGSAINISRRKQS